MYRTLFSEDEQAGELKVNEKVCIHPLFSNQSVDMEIICYLEDNLHWIFGEVTTLESKKLPESAFDRSRGQFNSTKVLEVIDPLCDINLGVLEEDLYSYGFNFIFGEAELGDSKAAISIYRLRPEFYGHEEDKELLKLRSLKEAVHEIGHVIGLQHCPDEHCVMHFSNTVKATDVKDWRYCKRCWSRL